MIRKILPFAIFVVSSVCLIGSTAYSQGFGVVDEAAAGNFFVIGARALGMGGAHIAVASDATALVYNPAGLARVTRIEFSGGLTHQRLSNETKFTLGAQPDMGLNGGPVQNNTRFSSANVVLPVPTYRGSLVFALGVNRVKSFDRTMEYFLDEGSETQAAIETGSGGIYVWSFGAGVDVSPNISVGAALNYWSGKDNYAWFYERIPITSLKPATTYDDIIKDRYSGFNAKFGFRIQPNKYVIVGGTIDSPVTYKIEEDWTQITEIDSESDYGYGSSEYKISLPFSLGAGLALQLENLTLAGDVNYTDWTQMEYKRLEYAAEANRLIKETYIDALRFNLGAEYLIPSVGTSLRIGFYHDPLPYKSRWVEKDRNFFTAGVGFLIDEVMTLDVAWAHGSWELHDVDWLLTEKYTTDRIFLSLAYRL
ncbi:MAG: outer membrane protein transport protein [Candidatus Zixiibacteriota bacterium]